MSELAGPALVIPEAQYREVSRVSEAAYPEEGCGVLVGRPGEAEAVVTQVVAGHNLVRERRLDRYELDPRDIILAERQARESGEEVLGFFHTHPDHPARPSQFDTDHAWAGYHYLVVAVEGGRVALATAWLLHGEEQQREFRQVPLRGAGGGRGYNPSGLVAEGQ